MKYKIERFLSNEDNRAAIKLLVERMKLISDIRNARDEKDFLAKKEALLILEDWISDLFDVTKEDLKELEESDYDEIIRNLE